MKYLFWFMFIGTVFLANWLISNIGTCHNGICVIPVGFGLYAPSGVLAIGIGFTLRDLVQRYSGIKWTISAIIIGAILSAYLNPFVALASGLAFLLSETLDLLVYTPLRNRNLTIAVFASNIVGITVDSFIFLYIAQIPMEFLLGQIWGKFLMTLLALPVIWFIQKRGK